MEAHVKKDMGEIHRTLLCQGPVELTSGKKMNKRHLSLFNDVLVVSNNLKKRKFKIKYIIPLNYLCAMDDVNIVNLVRINDICTCKTLALFWPTGSFLATFRSKEQKDHWYYFLKRSIKEAKMGIQKNYTMQIFTEDIPNCDSPVYVTAKDIDTVNDIIMKLLPMMRMPNNLDYQLWFRPGHGEAPRALKCYEYPYEVIMTHLQYTYSRLNSKNSTAFPMLPGLLGKGLNLDQEGQFILKPRYSVKGQQQNAKETLHNKQKTYRTSRFHRGSVPHQDQVCPVPTVKKKGKLFGKELSSICSNGKWPAAILDILSLLREKGPTTEGIFNICPNEKLCKTVKDKLDAGEKLNIRAYSVHVVASILKAFLQTIKGSLFTSQLYEHWLDVPQMANDDDKLAAVKSLLEELPPANAAFLQQLFRILNKIAINSSVNHMTAYSLSAVLAPFILYLPSYRNKDLDNSAQKISLVTFLIKNSTELFGQDIVALWYETSFYYPGRENTSCVEITPSNISDLKETNDAGSICPKGSTYSADKDEPTINLEAIPQSEGIIESENREGDMNATQQATPQTPPAPTSKEGFHTFPQFVCLDKMLPVLLDMLSIIAEKGHESDDIFLSVPAKSQWALTNKIYSEQHINWSEECILTVAYVLKDFIKNIKGSLLSSDLYENWLSVPNEESLIGKITAIQSILPKMPEPNYLLLKHLISVLLKITTSAKNTLESFLLSLRIAPYVLWDQTCETSLFGSDEPKKISLIQIMIDNFAHIFGEDDHIICDSSQKTSSDDIKSSGNTTELENQEGDMNATQQATSQTPPAPTSKEGFHTFTQFVCLDKMLPSLLDMLSIIAEKGQESDDIFLSVPAKSQWALTNKIYSEQHINWSEECILTVAYVLKDFIKNIKGSLLSSDLYENWLSVPNEESLIGKITAIQSILPKMPEPNYLLLKHLISVLLKITTSAKNTLESFLLSLRIAPYVLWDQTCETSLFGSDEPKKMSLIQIMIDNFAHIFGEDDHIICDSSQKTSSDDIKSSGNTTELENQEGDMNATQQATSQTPPAPMRKQGFHTFTQFVCLDKMLPSLLDMLSIIAEKGQESDDIFLSVPAKSQWALTNKIYSEQHINWSEECILTVAYVLKDFIKNIKGSLLSSDLYENWLSVPNEESLIGKITAIQSILPKMPEPNYLLLKHLISVLLKITTSAKNTLESFLLSLRIAPYVLWDQTCETSLFGSDEPKKLSVIQIMIDNFAHIFGEDDHTVCDNSQKTSDDIKTSVNTVGKSPALKKAIDGHSEKPSNANTDKLRISSASIQAEVPTAGDNETTPTYDLQQEEIPQN